MTTVGDINGTLIMLARDTLGNTSNLVVRLSTRDNVPPAITYVNLRGHPYRDGLPDQVVRISFDEPVKASTVFDNVILRKTSDGSAANFNWSVEVPLDSDELRDTFWAQTQGLERGSRYWFQVQPGIEDALGNSTVLQETPVATFSIYPQKGGIAYPRSNRIFRPKDPPKVLDGLYEAIDEAGAARWHNLVNQNDER